MSNQKGYSTLFVILGIVLLLGMAGGVYYYKGLYTPKSDGFVNLTQSTATQSPISNKDSNWELYSNKDLGFSISHPKELKYKTEEAAEVSLSNIDKETVKAYFTPSTNIQWNKLYADNYFSITISVDNNPTYVEQDGAKPVAVNEDNLIKLLGTVDKKPIETTIQGRKTVGFDRTMIVGTADQIGGSLDYYIFDSGRVIHLSAMSYNLNKFPLLELHKIFSSFKFTN